MPDVSLAVPPRPKSLCHHEDISHNGSVRFIMEADACPQILARLLGVTARLGLKLKDMTATFGKERMSINFTVRCDDERTLSTLEARIEQVIGVQSITLHRQRCLC